MKQSEQLLKDFNIENLDVFEYETYTDLRRQSTKTECLQILINEVEGDYSQLSPQLAKIARLQDKGK